MTASESAPSAQMPNVGDVVAGKFVIERLIGQGGMGAVFAARHRELDSVVAVKVMLADTTNVEATARFKNEGRAAAKIRSQHVVRVEDVGEEKGYAYMILELLEGEDLAQILEKRKRLPAGEVVHYLLEALEGVRLAHEKGIIHRDLKPSNLFLARRDDGTSVVKVLDFGISKSASSLSQAAGNLTSTKAMLGSPLYMSPEQLRSSKSVDVRADIWALGVIMYELLTGTLPFMGESLGELFAAILENDPAPPSSRAPDVPADLDAIVMRCLQRRPEHRFQSVSELIAAVASFTGFTTQTGLGSMGTRVLPGGPAGAAYPARAAMGSQPHVALSSGAYAVPVAPAGPRPSLPGATTTGSGSNIPVVKGTMPFGAVTPQPYAPSPGPGFPTTGSTVNAGLPSKNNGFAIAIAAAAVLVVGGAVVGGLTLRKGHDATATASSAPAVASSIPAIPVEPVASVAASMAPSAEVPPAETPGAAVSASVPVAVEATAGKKPTGTHGTPSAGAPAKPREPVATPVKTEPAKPAEVKPAATPAGKPSEPKFENMR